MLKIIAFWDCEDGTPEVGYEFYLVSVYFQNSGEERLDGHSAPQRTNMSHEERAEGWLGTTNNIDKEALGKYRVNSVLPNKRFAYNSVKADVEKIVIP